MKTTIRQLASFIVLGLFLGGMAFAQSSLASTADVDVTLNEQAQFIDVSGTVSGEDGGALAGVTVFVKGTNTGAITDDNGRYSVSAPDDNGTLVFSYYGYSTQEIDINGRTTIDVTLVEDIATLDQVIVTGYGTQKKRDITAAISSVDGKKIAEIPTSNTVDALKGRVAGVDVQQVSGRPGQNPQIQIRGQRSINAGNNPLFVVDGIPLVNDGTAFDINPQDIASVEILKDAASTSIYGSRGANGVILITTKRGSSGKTSVSYDGFIGASSPIKMVDMMNGAEFADMKRESRRTAWNGTIPADENVFEDPAEFESLAQNPVRFTDYQDLVLEGGITQNHQVSIRGGSQSTQFLVSANYFREEGLIENMDFTRYSVRLNLDNQVTDWLKIGTSNYLNRSIQNFGSSDVFNEALANNPLGVPFDDQGNVLFLPINDGIRTNPLSELEPGAWADERIRHTIFTSVYAQVDILQGLKYTATAGFEIRPERQGRFRGSQTNDNRGGPADARKIERTDFSYTIENLLTYDKELGNSDLKLTFLQSIQSFTREGTSVEVDNLPFDSQGWDNLSTGQDILSFDSELSEWSLASFMGRINYDIADKYLIQANIRADGSSRLAPGNKWAYFPGVSVGWRMVEEDFLSGISALQDLKLRASWGQVGNTSIDPYQTQGTLRRTTYDFDGSAAFGYALNNLSNPDLTWEVTTTLDIGVDFAFYQGRIQGSIDWYKSNTTDLLLERSLPRTSGYSSILFNVGETENQGVELSLETVNFDMDNGFRWTTQLNWFKNTEKIVSLATGDDDVGNGWFIGQPVDVIYDFKKIGIWQADEADLAGQFQDLPGEIKLEDVNGNGAYDGDDRQFIGTDVPDWAGGITNRFEYANFDFSFFFFARVGHWIQSNFHSGNNTLFARYNNLNVDYWTIDNPTNAFPRPNQNQERPKYSSTMSYFEGSYLKLRNVTLGYNFPASVTDALNMRGLRVYASAQNPWFTAKYATYDPEAGGDSQVEGSDPPPAKLFLIGVNVQF